MAKRIPEEDLTAIEQAVQRRPDGATAQQIQGELKTPIPLRTLQYRLKHLTTHRRIVKDGQGRWAKYRLLTPDAPSRAPAEQQSGQAEPAVPLSQPGAAIQSYVRQPPEARKPAGYNREFLNTYRPNVTSYLSAEDLELAYEIMQPDGSTDFFPVALRRSIGLVRLSGDDRNDRDLRLVQGSALDRLLSDKGLRSRMASELANSDVKDELTDAAKKALEDLDTAFKKKSLPDGFDSPSPAGRVLRLPLWSVSPPTGTASGCRWQYAMPAPNAKWS